MKKLKILSAHETKVGTYEGHEVTACIGNDGKPFIRVGIFDFDPETLLTLTYESMYAIGRLAKEAGKRS